MTKQAQLNLTASQLETLKAALIALVESLAPEMRDFCYLLNTQPRATADLILKGEDYQSLMKRADDAQKLLKQISYQERLLSGATIRFGGLK